jgi:Opioid growth factor receptor (OGFr) conserved region
MPRSRITDFYLGEMPDHRGRNLDDLHTQTLEGLELTHDYIQWLFPLPERSSANPDAPLLSASDIREFSQREELRSNLLRSLTVMLQFYGMELVPTPAGPEIHRSDTFHLRSKVWLTPFNHNFLRLSRILRSLTLLSCKEYADGLFRCLEEIYRENPAIIGQETFGYWKTARR